MLTALATSAMLQASVMMIATLPPAPPPPPVAKDQQVREAVDVAVKCTGEESGRNAAMNATADLKAAMGSAEWIAAREKVLAHIQVRQKYLKCINDLDTQMASKTLSFHDREVVQRTVQNLTRFWLQQGAYERQVLIRLMLPGMNLEESSVPVLHPF